MRIIVLILTLAAAPSIYGSALFDDDSLLEIKLKGPLTTAIADKRNRGEYPFELSVDGEVIPVEVRIRGNSRVRLCRFPPLRLNFPNSALKGTPFDGEDKLKLVTHCRNGNPRSQDAVLNEFAAYRVFNQISELSYRVRLLKIQYEDTDGRQRNLEDPHYGLLIESDEGLAKRMDGRIADVDSVIFSRLDSSQVGKLTVFQYLIGNKDWSFVTADTDDTCCHNLDLFDLGGALVPIPYDFDLAAITRANYRSGLNVNLSKRREYSGYCRTSSDTLDRAIGDVRQLEDEIIDTVRSLPVVSRESRERRVSFVAEYFAEAADKPGLLAKFDRDCIGSR